MSISPIAQYILFACLFNTSVFMVSAFLLFRVYKLPMYHIMVLYEAYHCLGFVVRPWELYFSGESPSWDYIGFVPSGSAILWAAFLVNAAHLAMVLGFMAVNRKPVAIAPIRPISFHPRKFINFVIIIVAFIALGAYGSRVSFGDMSSLTDTLQVSTYTDLEGGQHLTEMSGYQTVFAELLPITLVTLFAVKSTRTVSLPLIAAFIGYRMLAGAGRLTFVVVVLAIIFIVQINAHRRYPPKSVIIVAVLVFAIFNFMGADRLGFRKMLAGELTFSEYVDAFQEKRNKAVLTGDMEEFDVMSSIVDIVPERSGFTYGSQYLRLLIWPIPRQIWEDKPVFTSTVNLLDYANFSYLTYTLYADSYMTIGIMGMVVILFAISYYLNNLYKKVCVKPTPARILIYIVHAMFSMTILRDGPVSAAYFILSTGFGAWVVCRVSDMKMKVQDGGQHSSVRKVPLFQLSEGNR